MVATTCLSAAAPLWLRPTDQAFASRDWAMARRIALIAGALTLLAGLAGCDKCGDWQQLRVPELPKSCADHGAR